MLGLAWTCDWMGCTARMVQAYDDAWGVYPNSNGWIDGSWDMGGSGWAVDPDGKVWCGVHALTVREGGTDHPVVAGLKVIGDQLVEGDS